MQGPSTGGGGRFEDEVALNLTAMIDICFLLLTFLLLGTHFRVPEGQLDSEIPNEGKVSKESALDDLGQIMVVMGVGDQGPEAPPVMTVQLTAGAPPVRVATMEQLEAQLRGFAQDKKTRDNVPVVLRPDSAVPFHWVVSALDISSRLQFKKIQFSDPGEPGAAKKTPGKTG